MEIKLTILTLVLLLNNNPQAINLYSIAQNTQFLDQQSYSVNQALNHIQHMPQDKELLQTNNKFLGNIVWSAFDLITFGAFEKKPKLHKEEDKNQTVAYNKTQVIVQKVIEYRDRPIGVPLQLHVVIDQQNVTKPVEPVVIKETPPPPKKEEAPPPPPTPPPKKEDPPPLPAKQPEPPKEEPKKIPEVPRPAGGSEPADAHGPVGFDVTKTSVASDADTKPKVNPEQPKKEGEQKPQISSAPVAQQAVPVPVPNTQAPAGSVPADQQNKELQKITSNTAVQEAVTKVDPNKIVSQEELAKLTESQKQYIIERKKIELQEQFAKKSVKHDVIIDHPIGGGHAAAKVRKNGNTYAPAQEQAPASQEVKAIADAKAAQPTTQTPVPQQQNQPVTTQAPTPVSVPTTQAPVAPVVPVAAPAIVPAVQQVVSPVIPAVQNVPNQIVSAIQGTPTQAAPNVAVTPQPASVAATPQPAPVTVPAAAPAKPISTSPSPSAPTAATAATPVAVTTDNKQSSDNLFSTSQGTYSDEDLNDILKEYTPREDASFNQVSSSSKIRIREPLSPMPGGIAVVQKKSSLNVKLDEVKKEHNRNIDNNQVDEIFHSFSHMSEGEGDEERVITLEGAQMAQQELFRKWEIDLSDNEQKKLDTQYLIPAFKDIAEGRDTIDSEKSEKLMQMIISKA